MISLKQLNYAVAVGKERHFKRAAELCSVSQSALSSAIAELENQLDAQLFERDNKRVLVTPIGEQVLHKAREILAQVEELRQLPQQDHAPLSYPMTLGVIPTIGPYLLPQVLPRVRRDYPNFPLSIVEAQSQRLLELVRRGELDAAIIALPYPLDGLEVAEFWCEDFYLVAHQAEPIAQQSQVTAAELSKLDLLLLKDGHCLKDHAMAACRLNIQPVNQALGHTSLYTLIQMVAGRMGTTLVPEMALQQLLSGSSELAALHLDEPGPHRSIALVSRSNYSGKSNIRALTQLFREELSGAGPRSKKKHE
ncbi:MAG: LysR substrate-binding domain-containing protein [Granulosicoccaceae bacterium]